MPMEAVNLLHQPSCAVAVHGMADFFRRYKTDPDVSALDPGDIKQSSPVAEPFPGTVNSSVIPVLSDPVGTEQAVPRLFLVL